MGLAMLITARGYPQIYYGTEIMLDGVQGSYEGHRFDFPGGWPADSRNAFTAAGRSAEENEIFDYLKLLLNYRKNNPVLQSGKMKQFIPEDGIYVTFRYNAEKTIMVIANNNANGKDVDLKRFDEMLTGKTQGTDIVTQKTYRLDQAINVAGKSVLIMEV
jgi:glycosidase